MPRILHLSDIHLGDLDEHQELGDYKSDVVPLPERENRIEALRRTLSQLDVRLRADKQQLDAVVVSGDLTLQSSERGFQLLDGVLGKLGASRPPNSRIAIVPGNHDVHWFTPASTPRRYRHFLRYVRDCGFVTPVLDGVDNFDIDKLDQDPAREILLSKHAIVDPERRWAIVPMNSSNYCGSLESVDGVDAAAWEAAATSLVTIGTLKAPDAFRKIRTRDMPRISPWQFDVLGSLIQTLDRQAKENGGRIAKIVTMHHHLLPVSVVEENKAFESFANLGLVRSFLRDSRIDVVLHGHKHTAYAYRDSIHPTRRDDRLAPHSVLVISGGTVGLGAVSNEACRLLDLNVDRSSAPLLSVAGIEHPSPGHNIQIPAEQRYSLWPDAPDLDARDGPSIVRGASTHEVYDRIQALFNGEATGVERHGVIAIITDPSDAPRLPPSYPEIEGVKNRQAWFDELVSWWQLPKSELGDALNFTHGSSIFRADLNQVERAIEVLRNPAQASRAVVALLDPTVHDIRSPARFPSFCLLQLVLRHVSNVMHLDAVGYFRNQEMRYWWPVNAAEIGRIHRRIFDALKPVHARLRLGHITTIATLATVGTSPPLVAVSELDRMLDMDREGLWNMAYALVWSDMPERDDFRDRWNGVLDGLVPAEGIDPRKAPVTVHGLRFLVTTLDRFRKHHSRVELETVSELLHGLLTVNDARAQKLANGDSSRHREWVEEVKRKVGRLRSVLEASWPRVKHDN